MLYCHRSRHNFYRHQLFGQFTSGHLELEQNNDEAKLLTSSPAFVQDPHDGWAHRGHQAPAVLREALSPATEGKL